MSSRRKRGLSEDERELWQKVTDSVAPLEKPRRARKKLAESEEPLPVEPRPKRWRISSPRRPRRNG